MSRIAFIWYWDKASSVIDHWRDGLRAAMEEIAKEHTVDWFLDETLPEDTYDAYLMWGDSNCPAIHKIKDYKGKKGICLSTDPHNPGHLKFVDVVFCESTPVYDQVRSHGLRAIKAFGTDTTFFTPTPGKKDIEYFYPATFSPWKRQHVIAHLGKQLLCVGTVQPDGREEFQSCVDHDVCVKEGYFPVEEIRDFYNRTKKMIIPAIHGSERTVLEAMSLNILPVVAPENRKAHSYLEEFHSGAYKNPRDFVEKNYSAERYAQNLLKGLL